MNAPAKAFVIDASVLLRAFLRDELHAEAVDSLLYDNVHSMSAIIWVGNYRRENNSEGHP